MYFCFKMIYMYLLTRIVYILRCNHTIAVNPTRVNIRNCQMWLFIHVKILQKTWLCLFMLRPNTMKQLKWLSYNRYTRCLGGLEVRMRRKRSRVGFDSRHWQGLCLLLLFVVVESWGPKTLICHAILQFHLQCCLIYILNILQNRKNHKGIKIRTYHL